MAAASVSLKSSLFLSSPLSDFGGAAISISAQNRRRSWQPRGARMQVAAAADSKNILIMGGTRFIGLFLSRKLVQEGHQVTLFTRGKAPITQQLPGESDAEYAEFSSKVLHLKGDRKDFDFVKTSLSAKGFNVVYDINGREATEVSPILEALPNLEQFIYCSSAGVYLKSDLLPHFETDAVDPKSRHKGKLETESLLETSGVNWTSIRPVYIYGPLNYNPVEEWFFHRLKAGRPIPIPNAGNQITQLGHVKDLATAFIKVLGNPKASKQVYNISGSKYVTFDGIARACAKAGGFPEPEIIHYNPKDFDFGKKKAFPFRDQEAETVFERRGGGRGRRGRRGGGRGGSPAGDGGGEVSRWREGDGGLGFGAGREPRTMGAGGVRERARRAAPVTAASERRGGDGGSTGELENG